MAKCTTAGTPTETTRISVVAHPPERRRQSLVFVASGCCCSCCCSCCLHSIGAVVGASIAGAMGAVSSASVETRAARSRGQWIYWLSTAILCALTVLTAPLTLKGNVAEGVAVGLIILVVAMPLIQLVGAVVAAIIIVAAPFQHKSASLAQVGKLTLGMVAGTAVGVLILAIGLGGLTMLFKR
jgi:hypothetical protein